MCKQPSYSNSSHFITTICSLKMITVIIIDINHRPQLESLPWVYIPLPLYWHWCATSRRKAYNHCALQPLLASLYWATSMWVLLQVYTYSSHIIVASRLAYMRGSHPRDPLSLYIYISAPVVLFTAREVSEFGWFSCSRVTNDGHSTETCTRYFSRRLCGAYTETTTMPTTQHVAFVRTS